jgi:hypothetical protein
MPSVITKQPSPSAAKTTHFGSHRVLEEQLITEQRRFYIIGYEEGVYRLPAFMSVLIEALPEFALGGSESVPQNEMISRLRDAAKRVYESDKNLDKRGEWGELILHVLMRDYLDTTPLLSKIFFKDATDLPAHGFDGVHYKSENGNWTLWFGESKIYEEARGGIDSLVEDIERHVNSDFLRREFILIKEKINKSIPDRDDIIDKMHANARIGDIYQRLNIVLTCTYECDSYSNNNDQTDAFVNELSAYCKLLTERFESKLIKQTVDSRVNFYLLLLPIKSKGELTNHLHKKLKAIQEL